MTAGPNQKRSPDEVLADLGIVLPEPPAPAAAYVPWTRVGDLVFTAGQIPIEGGAIARTGLVGSDLTVEEAAASARICAVNVLAVARAALGDLAGIRVVKLTVFVASAPGFTEQHVVANGASEFMGQVLGSNGVHARSAVGVAGLPLGAPVEVEAVLTLA